MVVGWRKTFFFLGHSGVVQVGGVLRIAGVSGIFNHRNVLRGYSEFPPYTPDTIRSAYHMRKYEVDKLKLVKQGVDICISHDWPRGIEICGDAEKLLEYKQHFREDMDRNTLGNPLTAELLDSMRPSFWFAGHLHCRFAAVVEHNETPSATGCPPPVTRFLALDKPIPRRNFLHVLQVDRSLKEGYVPLEKCTRSETQTSFPGPRDPPTLFYDPEWLAIIRANHHLTPTSVGQYTGGVIVPDEVDIKWIQSLQVSLSGEEGRHVSEDQYVPFKRSYLRWPPWTGVPGDDDCDAQRKSFLRMLHLSPDVLFIPPPSCNEVSRFYGWTDERAKALVRQIPPPPPRTQTVSQESEEIDVYVIDEKPNQTNVLPSNS